MRAEPPVFTLSLLALGCAEEVREPLDLDALEEPSADCVTVIHESLDLGPALHGYVADGPGSPGGWALVTILNELDIHELGLVRLPASPDEAPTAPIELGFSSLAAVRIDLRAGAVPGELWVLQESATASALRKLVPGQGVVLGNGSLANFPAADGGSGCPYSHDRQLVLIEGRPYILAIPDCSDSPALDLQLLELDPDSLVFTSSWLLGFDPCAGDPQCETLSYQLASIRGGESSQIASAKRVAVGFSQVRTYGDGLARSDVSLLELRLDAGTPAARLVTFREVWATLTNLGPVHLAQDLFSVQLHVRNGGSQHDAALLRFDGSGELYVQVKNPGLLPLDGRGRLVQLASGSAIVDVHDGALEAVSLVDVASWPVWNAQTLYELEDLIGLERAGVGQLLLHREDAPPQVVELRCLE